MHSVGIPKSIPDQNMHEFDEINLKQGRTLKKILGNQFYYQTKSKCMG